MMAEGARRSLYGFGDEAELFLQSGVFCCEACRVVSVHEVFYGRAEGAGYPCCLCGIGEPFVENPAFENVERNIALA